MQKLKEEVQDQRIKKSLIADFVDIIKQSKQIEEMIANYDFFNNIWRYYLLPNLYSQPEWQSIFRGEIPSEEQIAFLVDVLC